MIVQLMIIALSFLAGYLYCRYEFVKEKEDFVEWQRNQQR